MKFLTSLVVVMGIMIIIGSTLLVVKIYNKVHADTTKTSTTVAETIDPSLPVKLDIGGTIKHMTTDNGQLILHIEKENNGQILYIDPDTGNTTKTLNY